MWVWRDETVRGGWRLDGTGSWRYDEPAQLESVGGPGRREHEARARELDARARERWARERFVADQRARSERLRPALAATPGDPFEAEPIFRSVAHEVREERRYEGGRYRHTPEGRARTAAHIPAPHPGSGPFPAQGGGRRRLAPVESVPPPPARDPYDGYEAYENHPAYAADPYADHVAHEAYDLGPTSSPEDELRRRAERRRRPRVEPESGRHVLRR